MVALSLSLDWKGHELMFGHRKMNIRVVEDERYPGVMWRVQGPDGKLSDMVNLSRAKDAAKSMALGMLTK